MLVINPLQALVHPQTQKRRSCMDCQSPSPTAQNLPFLLNGPADYELWISIFKAIGELVCCKNPNLLFYV
jgi:hypothetical protein